MITITVDREDELDLVRDSLITPVLCNHIDKCGEKYSDCKLCKKDNGDKYIKIFKREIVETQVPLVI